MMTEQTQPTKMTTSANRTQRNHSRFEREVAKKKCPTAVGQVWSTPSFKALKRLNLFDLR